MFKYINCSTQRPGKEDDGQQSVDQQIKYWFCASFIWHFLQGSVIFLSFSIWLFPFTNIVRSLFFLVHAHFFLFFLIFFGLLPPTLSLSLSLIYIVFNFVHSLNSLNYILRLKISFMIVNPLLYLLRFFFKSLSFSLSPSFPSPLIINLLYITYSLSYIIYFQSLLFISPFH